MSEIADAVQIIRVTYDGIEIAMKMGSAGVRSMQKALDNCSSFSSLPFFKYSSMLNTLPSCNFCDIMSLTEPTMQAITVS
mgnify:CR=1 FL=1